MSRSVSWRRLRNAAVEARIDEALQSIMYIVNQTGPTGFVIKQERVDKKITVTLNLLVNTSGKMNSCRFYWEIPTCALARCSGKRRNFVYTLFGNRLCHV